MINPEEKSTAVQGCRESLEGYWAARDEWCLPSRDWSEGG